MTSWEPTEYPIVDNTVVRGLFIDEFGAHFIEEHDDQGEIGWRVYLYTAPEVTAEELSDDMPGAIYSYKPGQQCLFWKSRDVFKDLATATKAYDRNMVPSWFFLGIIHRSREDGLKKKAH